MISSTSHKLFKTLLNNNKYIILNKYFHPFSYNLKIPIVHCKQNSIPSNSIKYSFINRINNNLKLYFINSRNCSNNKLNDNRTSSSTKEADNKKKLEVIESETSDEASESSDSEEDVYNVDEVAITNNDPMLLKKLKLAMLEYDTFKEEGQDVPSKLDTGDWKSLIELNTRTQKLKYLRFLFINEVRKNKARLKKQKRRIDRIEKYEEYVESLKPGQIKYGLGGSTIFIRVNDATINVMKNNRLVTAMKFGQNLILDCSFHRYMTKKEIKMCGKQLLYVFSCNRNDDDPFNIHFTSVTEDNPLEHELKKCLPTLYEDDFPINVTDKHYLDLFPKERLVYLTPHCREDLVNFNHDDIYIIGGIVDQTNPEPVTLARAKSEGLRMARFPLDRYLSWQLGSKSLTLDQCMMILLEMKRSNDWVKALKHVPQRKLFSQDKEEMLREKEEMENDKRMQFGQRYVTTKHEWGINRNKRASSLNNDLRALLRSKKQKN